jgi:hypothetical protein
VFLSLIASAAPHALALAAAEGCVEFICASRNLDSRVGGNNKRCSHLGEFGTGVRRQQYPTEYIGIDTNVRHLRNKDGLRVRFFLFLCGAGLRAFGRGPEGSERDILLLGVGRNICQVFGFCTTYASRQTSIRGAWAPAMADWRWRIAD